MTLNAIEGKTLPVYGKGQHVRDWLYAEEHLRALRLVLGAGSEGATNLNGDNCEPSNLQVIEKICSIVDQLCAGLGHAPCSSHTAFVDDRPSQGDHSWWRLSDRIRSGSCPLRDRPTDEMLSLMIPAKLISRSDGLAK